MSYHAIVKQELEASKTGGEMITLTCFDIETREEFRSYIVANMKNFEHWIDIISHPDEGFIVGGLKRKKNNGKYNHEILNADCVPVIVKRMKSAKQMEKIMREKWAKDDFEKTDFGRLFKIDEDEDDEK
jgi:hypothetical protein